jgi:hypothetical protein
MLSITTAKARISPVINIYEKRTDNKNRPCGRLDHIGYFFGASLKGDNDKE